MTTVGDIFDFTEHFAPISTAADFDNCGVLVGDKESKVTRALVALDITPEVISEASLVGAELIISHHPVIFSGLKSISSDSPVYMLIKAGVSALCLHTNLDRADKGVNYRLACSLLLEDIEMYPEEFLAVGRLSGNMSANELARYIKDKLGADCVTYTDIDGEISTLAVSSGAGGDAYHYAVARGAQAFLSGEIKHHEYLEAKLVGVPVFAAGHFHTENIVTESLARMLSEKFTEVEFKVALSNASPTKSV